MRKTHTIFIHHSAVDDHDKNDTTSYRWYHIFKRGWADIGYHGVVERIGEEIKRVPGRSMEKRGVHVSGHNTGSIGLCVAGNFDLYPPDEALLDELAEWIADIIYERGSHKVRYHNEVSSKSCPGKHFPSKAELMKRVNAIYTKKYFSNNYLETLLKENPKKKVLKYSVSTASKINKARTFHNVYTIPIVRDVVTLDSIIAGTSD